MSITSAIAIFFITWWVCLFVVLPWGVRNSHEAGEAVAEGHEAGAPVRPMMWRKVAITTVLASVVFASAISCSSFIASSLLLAEAWQPGAETRELHATRQSWKSASTQTRQSAGQALAQSSGLGLLLERFKLLGVHL